MIIARPRPIGVQRYICEPRARPTAVAPKSEAPTTWTLPLAALGSVKSGRDACDGAIDLGLGRPGAECTANTDCCEGFCGEDGTCRAPIVECAGVLEACASTDDCCYGLECETFPELGAICNPIVKD